MNLQSLLHMLFCISEHVQSICVSSYLKNRSQSQWHNLFKEFRLSAANTNNLIVCCTIRLLYTVEKQSYFVFTP